jgi:hypothetical protein
MFQLLYYSEYMYNLVDVLMQFVATKLPYKLHAVTVLFYLQIHADLCWPW